MTQDEAPDGALWIDGQPHTLDELTYREQRQLRTFVKELSDEPVEGVEDVVEVDLIPAFITVIKQRTDPGFTLDQALDFKSSDLEAPARPTKPAAKKRAAKKT